MKKFVLFSFVVALVVGIAIAITAAQEASPCTIQVHPGESLQRVIDRAPAGAVICIPTGTWTGNISIAKPLTLRGAGAGKTVISGKAKWAPTITVVSPTNAQTVSVTITNITVTGSGNGISGNGNVHVNIIGCSLAANKAVGLTLYGTARADLSDCTLTGNVQGIVATGSSRVTIAKSFVSNNKNTGIKLMDHSYAEISDATVADNFYGAKIGTANGADICGCTFSGNQFDGVDIYGSAQVAITGCTISGSGRTGIGVDGTANVSVTKCMIAENALVGIGVNDWAVRAVVTGCTVSGSKTGIWLASSARVQISDNRIVKNGCGVEFVVTRHILSVHYANGSVSGSGNIIPGPGDHDGNTRAALCPGYGRPWPNGFVSQTASGGLELTRF